MSSPNQYAVGYSNQENFDNAATEAIGRLSGSFSGQADLLAFFSVGYSEEAISRFPEHAGSLSPECVMGSNNIGAIAESREYYDGSPVLVVWAAQLPESKLTPFHLEYEQAPDGGVFVGWPDDIDCLDDAVLLTMGDPYSFPMDLLLHRLNEDRPSLQVVGGMASGVARPGEWSLFDAGGAKRCGASFVAIQGEYRPIPLVSQGCRPIGDPMVITDCERNEVRALGGMPATQKLFELFDKLPTREQKLLNSGLHLGFVVSEYKERFGYGDFLIRNVIGYDQSTGAINVGAFARVGQTVQFHVRDHETATIDLSEACDQFLEKGIQAKSALVFSCNGRGSNLFPEPDHDSQLLSRKLAIESLAGCFAAGEVGPVGGGNYVHGYTSSVAIFQ